ncbi:hypothetical protein [Plantactinospora sp. DSM 117369]
MTTDTNTHPHLNTTTSGLAVIFDATALRSWLADSTNTGTDANDTGNGDAGSRADELGINEFFSRTHAYLLSGLDDLLAALADDQQQTVWRLQSGTEHVGFFRTFDGEICDGAIIVVDLANWLRLASLHQDHRDFASLNSHGCDAAVEALANLATEANAIVRRYRSTNGPGHGTNDIRQASTVTSAD